MSDNTTHTLTETELAEIHGGASYMDASGRVHQVIDEWTLPPELAAALVAAVQQHAAPVQTLPAKK